jgi:hypothetical protein
MSVGLQYFNKSILCQDMYEHIKGEEALMHTQELVLDKAQSELR